MLHARRGRSPNPSCTGVRDPACPCDTIVKPSHCEAGCQREQLIDALTDLTFKDEVKIVDPRTHEDDVQAIEVSQLVKKFGLLPP